MATIGTTQLENGHSLTLVDAPVVYSGDRRERFEIQERDATGKFIQRFVYDTQQEAEDKFNALVLGQF